MPFFKADDSDEIPSGKGSADGKNPEQEEREALMAKIDEAGFVVNDLTLYLDTHKEDEEALRMFEEYANRKVMLMKEFAEKFYPLSQNCMVLCGKEMKTFSWTDGPAPWEGACI
ncbi:spore coat protein CotJB [Eisenbergiella tayi]